MSDLVWVTGGAGMIGSAVVKVLIDNGRRVLVLDNLSRGRAEFVHPHATLIGVDLAHPVPYELLRESPAEIYHLAARVGGVNYITKEQVLNLRNAAIDWNIMEAALHCGASLLYCSTACVYPVRLQDEECYAETGSVLLSEDTAACVGAQPESIYGWAKLLGELSVTAYCQELFKYQRACEHFGRPFKIVRMFNVYGPREVPSPETGHVIPALIHKVLCGDPPLEVWGSGRAIRAFTYVDDAAQGILTVMDAGRSGVPYNIGTPEGVTIAELAYLILRLLNIPDAESKVRFDESKPEGVFGRTADISRARKLGWEPKTSLADGIARTIAWCQRWLSKRGPAETWGRHET